MPGRSFLLLFALWLPVAAQTPAFEATSIKLNESGPGPSSMHITPGRASMQNVSLKKVMLNAYGIADDREYAIAGPDWLTSEHFDIEASFPAATPAPQVREMLQTMLTDRFKMVLHKETRQLPNYTLVIAKGGPKIKPDETPGQSQTSGGAGRFVAVRVPMAHFADLIARQAGLPVVNATGLDGVYSFTLTWSPEAALRVDTSAAPGTSSGPSIFTALQEQLGLQLNSGKGPVEVLVVDSMEKVPTAN